MEDKIYNCKGFYNPFYNYIYWYFLFHHVDFNCHLMSLLSRLNLSYKVGMPATHSILLYHYVAFIYERQLAGLLSDGFFFFVCLFVCFGLFLCHHFKCYPDHSLLVSIVSDKKSFVTLVTLKGFLLCIMIHFPLTFP